MTKYHNGTEMVKWWDKRCINDFMSRRMGIARMRQMRIKPSKSVIATKGLRGGYKICISVHSVFVFYVFQYIQCLSSISKHEKNRISSFTV